MQLTAIEKGLHKLYFLESKEDNLVQKNELHLSRWGFFFIFGQKPVLLKFSMFRFTPSINMLLTFYNKNKITRYAKTHKH